MKNGLSPQYMKEHFILKMEFIPIT